MSIIKGILIYTAIFLGLVLGVGVILIGIMYGLMACVGWEMAAEFFKSLGVVFGDTDAAEEE